MNYFDDLNQLVVSRITFPVTSYLYNRKHIISRFKQLIQSERTPPDEVRKMQLQKLQKLVNYLNAYVPFYQKRFRDIGFQPGDLKSIDDLKGLPPVNRADVIDHHKEMVDYRLQSSIPYADAREGDPGTPVQFACVKKHNLVRNTSSGSTGAPTIFYENGSRTALNWTHEMRLKYWFGVAPCAREGRLVRLSVDYNPNNRVIRMRRKLWNQLLLPGTNLGDAEYQVCLEGILDYKPKVLWGFRSADFSRPGPSNAARRRPGGWRRRPAGPAHASAGVVRLR